MNYNEYKTISAIPEASSMIETFRAIGYNIETAIADIIDNSISANAKNIWINFEWLGEDTWISIKDDGVGMDENEIIQAMRPGSINPLNERTSKDLGRFGLGLKTASFSQARKLTVISKKINNTIVNWTWDLDFVNQIGDWKLIKYELNENVLNEMSELKSGTIVLWNDIDRQVKGISKEDKNAMDKFLQTMQNVKKHIAMVFHKFIGSKRIKIYFQKRVIDAWDPFLVNESSTQVFPEERILNGEVKIVGFVLPHKSKLEEETYRIAEGINGWNGQQGFYVYRNDRLLLAGDWLGIFRKEEHYKLARIQIEISNSLDLDWQIDIKKSIARPPLVLKDQIKAYALNVRQRAVEVYRHKGRIVQQIAGQKFVPFWIEHRRGDKWFFKVNRENPILTKIKEHAKNDSDKAIETLLRFIEETIPSKSIYIKESEKPELQGSPFEATNHEIIKNTMQLLYSNYLSQGISEDEAKKIISNTEPFNLYVQFIDFLI